MSLTVVKASDFDDNAFLKKTTVSGVEKFISVSVAEMKALLGLPQSEYRAIWTQSSTTDPILSSELINNFTASPIPVTLEYELFWMSLTNFTRTSEGVYTLSPNVSAGLPSSNSADIDIILLDHDSKYMERDFSGNNILIKIFNKSDDSATDGFRALIIMRDWS